MSDEGCQRVFICLLLAHLQESSLRNDHFKLSAPESSKTETQKKERCPGMSALFQYHSSHFWLQIVPKLGGVSTQSAWPLI